MLTETSCGLQSSFFGFVGIYYDQGFSLFRECKRRIVTAVLLAYNCYFKYKFFLLNLMTTRKDLEFHQRSVSFRYSHEYGAVSRYPSKHERPAKWMNLKHNENAGIRIDY